MKGLLGNKSLVLPDLGLLSFVVNARELVDDDYTNVFLGECLIEWFAGTGWGSIRQRELQTNIHTGACRRDVTGITTQ